MLDYPIIYNGLLQYYTYEGRGQQHPEREESS